MREIKRCLAVAAALLTALVFAPAASADQSPEGCTGSNPSVRFADETLDLLDSPVRQGDEIVLAAVITNQGSSACNLSEIMVKVRLAGSSGDPEGDFVLISNVSLTAGTSVKAVNHNPYVVALGEDDFEAPLEIYWSATVHDRDGDSRISGEGPDAKITLTRPQATLSVTPSVTSGPPPLKVDFTYELTNTSPIPTAGLPAPQLVPAGPGGLLDAISDGNCGPVEYQSGDSVPPAEKPVLSPGETWTFNCSRTFVVPGTYSSQPSIVATSSADDRPWPQVAGGSTSITVLGPDLEIDKSHDGDLLAGRAGDYTLRVTNTGNLSTSGPVTVTDQLPTGLTASAISGDGWSCDLATVSCTRSDPLQSGAYYPDVTVKVVAADKPPNSVVNVATVSGGGEHFGATANNSDSDPTAIRVPSQPEPPKGKVFKVRKVTPSSNGTAKIKVTIPAAGQLVVDDAKKPDLLSRTVRKFKKAGTVSIVVKANRRLRKSILRSGKSRQVKVRISFAAKTNPETVSPISAFRMVTFRIRPGPAGQSDPS
ncbi:MAG: DUF11 domain-containing protein [Solirubrobacterales bacterium]|nr:DUF11 domain-containing protein [Solirubrobacterales bacterium]